MNSGFGRESQCNYVHTDEGGRHDGITNVETYRDRQGQTRTDRDIQGHTGTDKDKQGQAWTDRDKKGQAGTDRECPCLSLFVPALSLLVPACPWAVLGYFGCFGLFLDVFGYFGTI